MSLSHIFAILMVISIVHSTRDVLLAQSQAAFAKSATDKQQPSQANKKSKKGKKIEELQRQIDELRRELRELKQEQESRPRFHIVPQHPLSPPIKPPQYQPKPIPGVPAPEQRPKSFKAVPPDEDSRDSKVWPPRTIPPHHGGIHPPLPHAPGPIRKYERPKQIPPNAHPRQFNGMTYYIIPVEED